MPMTTLPPLTIGRARPPKWYRWRSDLASGRTTPAQIAAQLDWSLDDTLAWLYPSRRTGRTVRRNQVNPYQTTRPSMRGSIT